MFLYFGGRQKLMLSMKNFDIFILWEKDINPLDAKPFSLISAKGFLVKFVYREVMTLSV